MDQFWLTDEPFARIAPHRPADMQGKGRVDDQRAIGGIGHARESGDRGTDGPRDVYGPKKTLYIETLTQAGGPPFQVPIDSTAVKAPRCGAGGEGGSKARPSVARAVGARPPSRPRSTGGWKPCIRPVPDRGCNAIERMFGCRKDVRRIATRDDRLAVNDLAAVCTPRPSAIGYASGREQTSLTSASATFSACPDVCVIFAPSEAMMNQLFSVRETPNLFPTG